MILVVLKAFSFIEVLRSVFSTIFGNYLHTEVVVVRVFVNVYDFGIRF